MSVSERQELDPDSPWWAEHASRYQWAGNYTCGKSVLDAACGTGFGCGILAENTLKVIGLDINDEALRTSALYFKKGNVSFLKADVKKIPFRDNSFDAIVSFETIEHISEAELFINESARILKEDGFFICSTPNAAFSHRDRNKNPFHFHEYTDDELRDVLSGYFREVEILYQTNTRLKKSSLWQRLVWNFFVLRGIRKLPYALRNGLSRLLTGKSLFSEPADFEFSQNASSASAVIMAVCSKSKNR